MPDLYVPSSWSAAKSTHTEPVSARAQPAGFLVLMRAAFEQAAGPPLQTLCVDELHRDFCDLMVAQRITVRPSHHPDIGAGRAPRDAAALRSALFVELDHQPRAEPAAADEGKQDRDGPAHVVGLGTCGAPVLLNGAPYDGAPLLRPRGM